MTEGGGGGRGKGEDELFDVVALALEAGDLAVWEMDPETGHGFTSRRINELFGTPTRIADTAEMFAFIHPEDRERVVSTWRAYIRSGARDRLVNEYRVARADGRTTWVRATARLIDDPRHGRRVIGTTVDITSERELAAQLEQARKLEAIGRLAGGIAHDFNNLLTAMFASLHFAEAATGPALTAELATIRGAAERASELTRQLLAFARKQTVRIEPVDLDHLIRRLEPMLRRLLGEHVELVHRPGTNVPCARASESLVEQVIVNLATNARDAMPNGGPLSIETSFAELDEPPPDHPTLLAGTYACLAVRDAGVGMDAKTRAHLFEPFFTTKERGTGLGLASVHGIVAQLGGHILVDTRPGGGTTFRVLLPTHAGTAEPRSEPVIPVSTTDAHATTVLFVEDDDLLRRSVARGLQALGYDLLIAEGGAHGLALARAHRRPIDIVVTDVVMPGMSGKELARQIRAVVPATEVLFTSGYTDAVLARDGLLEPGEQLLHKPYTLDELADRIAELATKRR